MRTWCRNKLQSVFLYLQPAAPTHSAPVATGTPDMAKLFEQFLKMQKRANAAAPTTLAEEKKDAQTTSAPSEWQRRKRQGCSACVD